MNPAAAATPATGRGAAVLAVTAALTRGSHVQDALGTLRGELGLSSRDAALAAEIALGAVRHIHTLDHVLHAVAQFHRRRLSGPLYALLLTGAYQIIWMDRTPVFAAVDESVDLARRLAGSRPAGMVNAILRNLARAIDARRTPWQRLNPRHIRVSWDQACALHDDVLPAPAGAVPVGHLAAATGETPARLRQLVERFGPVRAEQVCWASQAQPPAVLYPNRVRISLEDFRARLSEADPSGWEISGEAAYFRIASTALETSLFREGLAYIQDTTAHQAAALVQAAEGQRILDLCAAPGGKSIAIAQQMHDRGQIVACDVSPQRLAMIDQNVARLGLTCIRTHLLAEDGAGDEALGEFDAAIVDVPCSNTGVIARRPEARLRFHPHRIAQLTPLQIRLLQRAAARVRPGGRLVYSTCSIEPEENEQVVARFLEPVADVWRLQRAQLVLPRWGPSLSDWRDGGYVAALVRSV